MNALVVGAPTGTALGVARALSRDGGPVTLVSGDTAGLLAALDEPGTADVDVLWADAADPATCDAAVVHRRLTHPEPAALVIAVDDVDDASWALGAELARRLPGVPWRVTGSAAAEVAEDAAALAAELAAALVDRPEPTALSGAGCCGS